MQLAVGTLLGPYEIVAPIGAGGMGEVYKARDTRLDRTVAIKVLRGDLDRQRPGFMTGRKGNYEIVETMGLYWHFVDLVWVFIFAVFYLW